MENINISYDIMRSLLKDAIANHKDYSYKEEVIPAGTYDGYEMDTTLVVDGKKYCYNYLLY